MLNTLIIAAFFMVVFFLVVSLYKQKKKWEKFNDEWKFNFELINKITDLTKENRRIMRDIVGNAESQQSEKVNKIDENCDSIVFSCSALTERLLQVYQKNVSENFKNLEVEIERKISDKEP
ncbi:MAG: hypothetical protein IKS96_13090 [Fibrobacter sp.]|nr:hypothetical protein [Fibrobacter sp.]